MPLEVTQNKSILFIIYQTGVKGNGGVQSVTNVIQELASKHTVYVLTQSNSNFNLKWENAGATVVVKREKKNKLYNLVFRNLYVFFLLKRINVSTVHCNDIQSLMASFLGVKLSFKKLIFNKRAVKPEGATYPRSWNIVLPFVDHVIVLSKDMMHRVVKHFPVVKDKISYTYSIVDFNKFKPLDKNQLKEKLNLPSNKLIFGIVGRFEHIKQQDLFIEKCVATLPLEIKQKVMFYLIGDFEPVTNAYAKKCQDLVHANQLESLVQLLPYQARVEEWYNVFDWSLVVSDREGLARCMIESLSCGVPVISFDVSSAKEILEEARCGIVVKANDFNKFKNIIIEAVNNQFPYTEFKEKAVPLTRKLLSLENVVKQYEAHYN